MRAVSEDSGNIRRLTRRIYRVLLNEIGGRLLEEAAECNPTLVRVLLVQHDDLVTLSKRASDEIGGAASRVQKSSPVEVEPAAQSVPFEGERSAHMLQRCMGWGGRSGNSVDT